MNIGLVGINHTKKQIKEFESIFLTNEGKQNFYTKVVSECPVKELVILTTCNRVEFYFAAEDIDVAGKWIMETLSIQKNVDKNITTSLLEIYGEKQTLIHLFEVASGVQSMVVGENEILGQVKEAYDIAFSKHKTGPILNKAFQSAIATGKRARAETAISRGAYSVSSIAIDAIRKTLLDYFEMTVLIIGMGTMGTRCLKKLDALAHPNISIANRTYETADKLTNDHSVSVERYDDVFENLSQYNIIISCVSVKDKIIIPTHFNNTAKTKLIIDLGLPRNIDPDIENKKSIQIINVDGLKEIATKNVGRRKIEVEKVNFIIESEYKNLMQWFINRQKNTNGTDH